MSIENNQAFQVQLIESLINQLLVKEGGERSRIAPTKIKSLYHLVQLNKKVIRGEWSENFQSKKAICKSALVSPQHFSRFVNSCDFELFGSVTHRNSTTNIYRLHRWVVDVFSFFEKTGLMKKFRTDFDAWRKVFLRRLHHWLLPLLNKGLTLEQILMNKLSTSQKLKGDGGVPLKGADNIKPIFHMSGSLIKPTGSRRITPLAASIVHKFSSVARELSSGFSIHDGDLFWLINNLSLKEIEAGIRIRSSMKGFSPQSPIKGFMYCVNKYRNQKRKNL